MIKYGDKNIRSDAFQLAQRLFSDTSSPKTCSAFGVGWGGSYIEAAELILRDYHDTTYIGFDSFQGLPKETPGVWYPDRHSEGCFSMSKNITLEKLANLGIKEDDPRFLIVDGWFKDTLTFNMAESITNLIYVNIDVDIHSSSIELLDFIKPFLRKNVILYWDDWKDPIDKFDGKWGEHLAWEEWSTKNPELVVETVGVNNYNQRIMKIISVD